MVEGGVILERNTHKCVHYIQVVHLFWLQDVSAPRGSSSCSCKYKTLTSVSSTHQFCICNWRRPFWGQNVLQSEQVYHVYYAQESLPFLPSFSHYKSEGPCEIPPCKPNSPFLWQSGEQMRWGELVSTLQESCMDFQREHCFPCNSEEDSQRLESLGREAYSCVYDYHLHCQSPELWSLKRRAQG